MEIIFIHFHVEMSSKKTDHQLEKCKQQALTNYNRLTGAGAASKQPVTLQKNIIPDLWMLHLHQVLHGVKVIPGQEMSWNPSPHLAWWGFDSSLPFCFCAIQHEEMLLGCVTVGTVAAGLNGRLFH